MHAKQLEDIQADKKARSKAKRAGGPKGSASMARDSADEAGDKEPKEDEDCPAGTRVEIKAGKRGRAGAKVLTKAKAAEPKAKEAKGKKALPAKRKTKAAPSASSSNSDSDSDSDSNSDSEDDTAPAPLKQKAPAAKAASAKTNAKGPAAAKPKASVKAAAKQPAKKGKGKAKSESDSESSDAEVAWHACMSVEACVTLMSMSMCRWHPPTRTEGDKISGKQNIKIS